MILRLRLLYAPSDELDALDYQVFHGQNADQEADKSRDIVLAVG